MLGRSVTRRRFKFEIELTSSIQFRLGRAPTICQQERKLDLFVAFRRFIDELPGEVFALTDDKFIVQKVETLIGRIRRLSLSHNHAGFGKIKNS